MRPPSTQATPGTSTKSAYHDGNVALVPFAPTYAARNEPASLEVRMPERSSWTAGSPATDSSAVAPIETARIIADWFGSRTACWITVAAPLPPVRPTNLA